MLIWSHWIFNDNVSWNSETHCSKYSRSFFNLYQRDISSGGPLAKCLPFCFVIWFNNVQSSGNVAVSSLFFLFANPSQSPRICALSNYWYTNWCNFFLCLTDWSERIYCDEAIKTFWHGHTFFVINPSFYEPIGYTGRFPVQRVSNTELDGLFLVSMDKILSSQLSDPWKKSTELLYHPADNIVLL